MKLNQMEKKGKKLKTSTDKNRGFYFLKGMEDYQGKFKKKLYRGKEKVTEKDLHEQLLINKKIIIQYDSFVETALLYSIQF